MNIYKYAINPNKSFGRIKKEKENPAFIFLKDKNRIIFSSSFRRLEYKTQVFVNHSGDHFRTRLTHSLEVAAIAKVIARSLNLNEDLTETIALAHDLGHPPFGHAGEEGLCEAMKNFGGFDHNFHTLKVVALLEKCINNINGLNLSHEVIEGLTKHNGAMSLNSKFAIKVAKLFTPLDLQLDKHPCLEAQIASLADDIAYCAHDIDDGIRAGFINFMDLISIDIIKQAINCNSFDKNNYRYVISNISKMMIDDLILETRKRLQNHNFNNPQDIKEHNQWVAAFSDKMEDQKNQIKSFLMKHVYRHHHINRMRYKAKSLMHNLFSYFMDNPNCLPGTWYKKTLDLDLSERAEVIGDYIAGMTDRFIIDEYQRIFDPKIS